MARIRSIHPDACDSKKLSAVTADAERLYWRLQTHCDDAGRCEDNPRLIHARCLPLVDDWTPRGVDSTLEELAEAGLIHRYTDSEGVGVVQVTRWDEYQHPNRPKPSKYGEFVPSRIHQCAITDRSMSDHGASIAGGERRGEEAACAVTDVRTPVDNRPDVSELVARTKASIQRPLVAAPLTSGDDTVNDATEDAPLRVFDVTGSRSAHAGIEMTTPDMGSTKAGRQ